MLGPERKRTQFTQEEIGRIDKMAHTAASRGEDAIQILKETKASLYHQAIKMLEEQGGRSGAIDDVSQLEHTIDTIQEVQERAEKIMKEKGTDDYSKLERIRRKLI